MGTQQIGGLRRLKFWLEQRRECLTAEAVNFGLEPPRGELMLGVQGAGKSLGRASAITFSFKPTARLNRPTGWKLLATMSFATIITRLAWPLPAAL